MHAAISMLGRLYFTNRKRKNKFNNALHHSKENKVIPVHQELQWLLKNKSHTVHPFFKSIFRSSVGVRKQHQFVLARRLLSCINEGDDVTGLQQIEHQCSLTPAHCTVNSVGSLASGECWSSIFSLLKRLKSVTSSASVMQLVSNQLAHLVFISSFLITCTCSQWRRSSLGWIWGHFSYHILCILLLTPLFPVNLSLETRLNKLQEVALSLRIKVFYVTDTKWI